MVHGRVATKVVVAGASRTQDGADLRPDLSVDAQADLCQLRNLEGNRGSSPTTRQGVLYTARWVPAAQGQHDRVLDKSSPSPGIWWQRSRLANPAGTQAILSRRVTVSSLSSTS